jgi:hypothetical protein
MKLKELYDSGTDVSEHLDNYEKVSSVGNYENAFSVVNALVGEMDDMEWFDKLFQYDDRFEY